MKHSRKFDNLKGLLKHYSVTINALCCIIVSSYISFKL